MHLLVELLDERDRLEVLATAVLVGDPLAGLARVVEVQHRGHGVDAQPVDVELLDPVQRVGDQEVAHLVAAEVEDQRAPVRLRAAARVGVLVQRGAVEARQRPLVAREVRRHPVDDDADAALVEVVDEPAQVVRRPVPRGGRVVAAHLVAPRATEGMLRDRQQLDVGEAHALAVLGELRRQVAVGEEGIVGAAPPRPEVHLVDRQRTDGRIDDRAPRHPFTVIPGVRELGDHAGRRRGSFGLARQWVCLEHGASVGTEDAVLVAHARAHVGDEDLPHTAGAERAHGQCARVPSVGVAHQRDAAGERRPDRERRAAHALVVDDTRAEPLPQPVVRALADEVQVELTECRQESVGVVDLPLRVGGAVAQPVAGQVRHRHLRLEEAAIVDALHAHHAAGVSDGHLECVGVERPHHRDVAASVSAEHLVGIALHTLGELGRRLGHVDACAGSRRRGHFVASRRNPSGTGTHEGRWASS